jgi:hypothetical protein
VKNIEISPHAYQQMAERGALEAEVVAAVRQGEAEPAREGRTMYRKTFPFQGEWRGRRYRLKQVAPVAAEESDKFVVVTVYVFYH